MRRGGNGAKKERGSLAEFRPILLLAVTVFIDLLGFGIILPNLPQYIELAVGRNHQQAAFIGSMLAASYSFAQFLCAPLWGRYSDKVGRRPVILISLIGVAAAYVLFGVAGRHLWLLFAARLLAGFLSSASIGVAFAYVADVTRPEKRAQGLGLLGACFGLGFMTGPAVGGLLGHFNLALPAFVAAGLALVNWAFTIRYLPESLTPEKRKALADETGGETPSTTALLLRVIQGPAGVFFLLTFFVTLGFAAMEQIFSFYLLQRFAGPEQPFRVTQQNQPLVTGTILGRRGHRIHHHSGRAYRAFGSTLWRRRAGAGGHFLFVFGIFAVPVCARYLQTCFCAACLFVYWTRPCRAGSVGDGVPQSQLGARLERFPPRSPLIPLPARSARLSPEPCFTR